MFDAIYLINAKILNKKNSGWSFSKVDFEIDPVSQKATLKKA